MTGINGITPISVLSTINPTAATSASTSTNGLSFSQLLSNAIDQVNNISGQADTMSAAYAAGGPISIDQLMVTEQQASLALDTVVQVRDRVVSAYQSIMNMQV